MRKCGVVMVRHSALGPCAKAKAEIRRQKAEGKKRYRLLPSALCLLPLESAAMKRAAALLAFIPIIALAQAPKIMFVMHGGAGTITRQNMTPDMEKQYREKLEEALRAGHAVLAKGGSSLDAVETSIRILEDSPLFNAGKGAVFTHEGTNELDASIMDGRTLKAGAVASVKHIKNPIRLARLVMEQSPHVMLAGEGAEAFAKSHGVELVPQEYFYTPKRWEQLQKAKL